MGVLGMIVGVAAVVAYAHGRQYCCSRHYSVSICPDSGCNEAFTSLTKPKYKSSSKNNDSAEKAKLTSV